MPEPSSYLVNNDAALTNLHAASFTLAFWFKPKALGPFVPLTIFSAPAWKVSLDENGKVIFKINDSTTETETSVSSTDTVGLGWNFVAVRYNVATSTLSVYLNEVTDSASFSAGADSSLASYTPGFQAGTDDRASTGPSAQFDLDAVTVWARALTDLEIELIYEDSEGESYPFVGGAVNLIFQGNLINDPAKPLVLGTEKGLWAVTRQYDSAGQQFKAYLDLLYRGEKSDGYSWSAANFYDKIIFAKKDNPTQYWLPPLPNVAHDLPGLPSDDAEWDGVTSFSGHTLLWKDDRLKWSDKDNFALYLPVAETAVSALLQLQEDFIQPSPGGKVSVAVKNTLAEVKSLSISGDLSFPDTAVGDSSTALLVLSNTGTTDLAVTGISFPDGFSGEFSGTIPSGGSAPVVVTFAPTEAVSYDGAISVASDATTGTSVYAVSGTGTGSTKIISLSGILTFGRCNAGRTLTSALIIENRGNSNLTVTSITCPDGFSGSFSGVISAGSRQIVPITFSPATKTSYAGVLSVESDATDGTSAISVSGEGIAHLIRPGVFLTDNGTLDFGKVGSGENGTGTLRIYNTSATSFTVLGLTLPSGFSGSFNGSIAPHSYQDVTITFSPIEAQVYSGTVFVSFNKTVTGENRIGIVGTGTQTGKLISLEGDLDFGEVPVNGSTQALLRIKNPGTEDLTITSISYPSGFSGAYAGVIAPGETKTILVAFSPTSAISYSGDLTVNSDKESGTNTLSLSGAGFTPPSAAPLVSGQFVSLEDSRGSQTYYNYYTVVSMDDTSLVLKLMDLTGATPAGLTMLADGRKFFTVDANEAGETRVVGENTNGPIFKVVPQGDYAFILKERSIQSLQYTGLSNGVFFVHNEVIGEGLIAREAFVSRHDGVIVFLGHKELYAYQGGPNPVPVCLQYTRQLFHELDRSRLDAIRLFHNESRKEIWVKYPITDGFRVLVWNYIEDSATLDDFDPSTEFTAFGLADWTSDVTRRVPLLASEDGNLRVHGLKFSRDGEGYSALSETMDFDLGDPDIWKYVDVVVLGLEVRNPTAENREMTVEVGTRASLNGGDITWSSPKTVLVNGQSPSPVKVNPGGAGRYLRLRFSSSGADVEWRISSFEVHCRQGGLY